MGCEKCDQLWKLYQHRRDIHLKLLKAARWGSQYLEEGLERADGERQDARYQLLKHKRAHGQDGSWFSGPLDR